MEVLRLLDLYCGGGIVADGYAAAGFVEIVGVDIEPQPYYPYEFVQGDAIEYALENGHKFDLIHASPPCLKYTPLSRLQKGKEYPDLVDATRETLMLVGVPWVMENVKEAPMTNYLLLCGTMFGLRTRRHRVFETWPVQLMFSPMSCSCKGRTYGLYDREKGTPSLENSDLITITGNGYKSADGRKAMGVKRYVPKSVLSKGVPPIYGKWIAEQMMNHILEYKNGRNKEKTRKIIS